MLTPLRIVFFVSGTAGLIYQIVWTRWAGLEVGSSTAAIGTVVATFLLGLAAGAALGGRWIDRTRTSALSAYAVLELGIAAYGLLFAPLLHLLAPSLGALYRGGGEQGVLFNLSRILLCAALILPPTLAMGATLPILSRLATARGAGTREIGLLYGINTLGAVAGAALAGWVLLPPLGLTRTTFVAAGLNVAVALAALALRRAPAPTAGTATEKIGAPAPTWIFPAYAVAGCAALVLEITWTRALILSFGSSVQAFSLVLACFIFGVGIGSVLAARVADRAANPAAAFAVLQSLISLWAVATWIWPLTSLPMAMMNVFGGLTQLGELHRTELAFAAAIVVPPTALMGAQWPLLCRLAVGAADGTGTAVGRLYAWNTAGNILGTLTASFLILPSSGIRGGIVVAAALGFFVAALAIWRSLPSARRAFAAIPAALAAGAFVAIPAWDPVIAAAGPAIYGRAQTEMCAARGIRLEVAVREEGDVIFERWDTYGLVTVHKGPTGLTLRVNGKADASTAGDMMTQGLTAHVPLLLHPNPRNALVVGLASGATLASALTHPGISVDCVEISPAVVEAHDAHFAGVFDRPTKHPRANLIVSDVRSHVAYSDRMYDVIASEPSNLWISGVANLFTREHLRRCRNRLAPGGIFCQFVHGYKLPVRDFQGVLATFRSVFPECLVWEVIAGRDYLLVGLTGIADYETLRKRWNLPTVRAHLESLQANGILRSLIGDERFAAAVAGDAPIITDDHTWVEFTAPAGLVRDERAALLELFGRHRGLPIESMRGLPDLAEGRKARALLCNAVGLSRRDQHLGALATLNQALDAASVTRDGTTRYFDPAYPAARDEIGRWAMVGALRAWNEGRGEDAHAIARAITADSIAWNVAKELLARPPPGGVSSP